MVRDLCKVNYQTLLIAYLKLTKKNVPNERKNVHLLDLKMIDYIIKAKNVEKDVLSQKSQQVQSKLVKKFPNIYKFCDGDLNKFALLLRKGVYPYEYMDSWERFNETSLPPKKASYSKLNLEDIKDEDYEHNQQVWEAFEIKILVIIMAYMFKAIQYCLQMYLKTLGISVLKNMDLILLIFCLHRDQQGKLVQKRQK